jgi:transposase
VSPATIAQVVDDLAAGHSMRRVARRHGVAVSTVHRYRETLALPYRIRHTRATSAQWRAAMALVDTGMSQSDAARRVGVSQSHLSRHLARRAA